MCWCTRKIENTVPIIAQKDVKCFKLLDKVGRKYLSPFFRFEYKAGKTYTNESLNEHSIRQLSSDEYIIEEGTHSYSGISTEQPSILFSALARCVIPKGSMYYLNEENEIVSNCIRIEEIKDLDYVLDYKEGKTYGAEGCQEKHRVLQGNKGRLRQ